MRLQKSKWKLPKAASSASFMTLFIAGVTLAASAGYVQWSSRRAERDNPPMGEFLTVQGTRLHYIDTGGSRSVVLLLHGNGSMARELEISGIVAELAGNYRVIAFDRPGFGYSDRPRSISWTPAAQAELMFAALRRKGIRSAIVLGHSWGNLVALELALRHPEFVKGLVLAGGFYFPVPRKDVALLSLLAVPVIGDVMRHTFSPLIARTLAPKAIRKIFQPRPVTERFAAQFPLQLALRPLSLRASAEEAAMMISAAAGLENRYSQIHQPTVIIAGSGDQIVDANQQSVRLHKVISHSELIIQRNDGHMVHYHASHILRQTIDDLASHSRTSKQAA